MVAISKLAGAAALFAGHVSAHGKPANMKRELVTRDHHAAVGAQSLGSCFNSTAAKTLKTRSVQRRVEAVKSLRQKRGIKTPAKDLNKRTLANLEAWEAINHNYTGLVDYGVFTSLEEVFDAKTSCILAPEVTDGPYYVVGEHMRSNVKEELYSEGVDLFLEVQYIDIRTCEALPNVAVDIWNANATGVYSGISESGNYAADGYNSTYLRGIQLTDSEGVVQFETIFPGHYDGRATHTHLLSHTNATVEPNGTISVWTAPVAHIGQLFYPESLRSAVEATYPYTTNTQAVVSNDDDMWSISAADASFDPIPQFLYLGDTITDGLFAWIQIGINGSADYTENDYYGIAAYLDADSGHSTGYSVGGGGATSGGDAGNGTTPSGAAPFSSSSSA